MSHSFVNHQQVLKAYDRDGELLETVTVEDWEPEASWSADMNTTESDMWRESDGGGEFEWENNEQVLSALESVKECGVFFQPYDENKERIYIGQFVHGFLCDMVEA